MKFSAMKRSLSSKLSINRPLRLAAMMGVVSIGVTAGVAESHIEFAQGKSQIWNYHHFGEDDYGEIEHVRRELLKENGAAGLDGSTVSPPGLGVEAAPDDER